MSPTSPVEGQATDVTVTVRNVGNHPTTTSYVVEVAYGLTPSQAVVLADQTVSTTLPANSSNTIHFSNLVFGPEGPGSLCVRVRYASPDPSFNNQACLGLLVQDSDMDPPVIGPVTVTEAVSENGILEAGEEARLEFSVTDVGSGVAEVSLFVDGVPVAVSNVGSTYSGTTGALAAGAHSYDVTAVDADTASPATVAIPTGTFQVASVGQAFVRGDADANASINIADLIFTLNYLFMMGQAPTCLDSADANDDGALNIVDAVYALAYLFSNGAAPPLPFPSCGVDTVDCASYAPCP